MFATIEHLDNVLSAIGRDKHCFTIKEKEGYIFIKYKDGYIHQAFPAITAKMSEEERRVAMLRRECRGIVFREKDGKLISRRFHKFFNLNERPECSVDVIDFSRDFYCLEKMDGTLISPIPYKNSIRFASQLGFSQQSELADKYTQYAKDCKYIEFCTFCINNDLTPCFEFVSDLNRIVIKYKSSNLILLAVRENESGAYSKYEQLQLWAKEYNIPLVEKWSDENIPKGDGKQFIKYVRDLKDIEGCVVVFEDTMEMYKCKTHAYSTAHSINPSKLKERQLWKAVVTNVIDDLVSMIDFDANVRSAVQKFRDSYQTSLENKVHAIAIKAEKIVKVSDEALERALEDVNKHDKQVLLNIRNAYRETSDDSLSIEDIAFDVTEKYILSFLNGTAQHFVSSKSSLYTWLNLSLKCIEPYTFESGTGVMILAHSARSNSLDHSKSKQSKSAKQDNLDKDEAYSRLRNKMQASKKSSSKGSKRKKK